MATIVDSYSESNYSDDENIGSSYYILSQSFTGDGGTLNSVKLYLKRASAVSGNVYVKIYAHTGTYGSSSEPTGSVLATSDGFDPNALTASYQLITFTFSGAEKITLIDDTKYCLVIEYVGSGRVVVGYDSSSSSHDGNMSWYNAGWNFYISADICFYVYKDDSVSVDVSLSPVSLSTTTTTPTITEGVGTDVSISPLSLTTTLLDVDISLGITVLLSLIEAGSVTILTPTIIEGLGVDATLDLVEAGLVTIPEVDVGIYQRVFLEALALSASLYEPTVSVERNWGQQGEQETTWTPTSAVTTTWTPASNNNTTWTPVVDTLEQS